jgi:hypothetical protein
MAAGDLQIPQSALLSAGQLCLEPWMRPTSTHLFALTLAAFSLSACATRSEVPMSAGLSEDDDAYCQRNGGPTGSPQYVACRKDRDVQHSDAVTRADKKQRDLGEYMLNHPN